jgi:DNA-binding beta-propeller fold protein YncE
MKDCQDAETPTKRGGHRVARRLGALAIALLLEGAVGCDEHLPTAPTIDAGADTAMLEPLEQVPAIIPPDQRGNTSSSPVVFDPRRGGAWTANGDTGTISYVDLDARRVVQEVQVGQDIRSIALSPDGVWIAAVDRTGASVSLVDAETRQVRRSIAVGTHPRACVWDAANPRWLYVAIETDGTVAVIDRTLGKVVESIDVGRLPSGLAVSRDRRELYVTHRIDAEVTIVDLHVRNVAAQIALADEPFTMPGVPNGKPLAFESLAITADGSHAWVPHELLASTHPFVFNQTLFPAISTVDLVGQAEQVTDPNDASMRIAGRKNLFDAISAFDDDGQPSVFSQICAVAMHPNGAVAWAIACGSEDLLTFGVLQGRLTDNQPRGLACAHPNGLTVDDTGQRLFIVCDESHTLLTFDTANGSLVGHVRMFGDPISLVEKDPIAVDDPQLRAGRRLFFHANSSTGAPVTTKNHWMSCGGCHLDGFGSNNLRLFEALLAPDPQVDAQTGHVGLKDHFSTVSMASGPSFNPHDILVALHDQGAPIDPDHPAADDVQVATQLARAIADDLPRGPAWLRPSGAAPNLSWDTSFCGNCHQAEYAAWSKSVHAHAAEDPMVLFGVGVEQYGAGAGQGPQYSRLCAGCHDPVSARSDPPDTSFQAKRSVTCLGCHDVEGEIRGGGNGDLVAASHDWTSDHKAWALASLDKLRQPEFCGGCHQQFVPGTGVVAISTLDEYHASPYAGTTRCVDCHMPKDVHGVADHHFPGGNVYLGQMFGDDALQKAQLANLTAAVSLEARRVGGGVLVTVRNGGAGHSFPTGVTDLREAWVELQTKDGLHVGGPGVDGLLPLGAARLGIDIATPDGTILYNHELTQATRIPFDVRVPAGEAQALLIALPSTVPANGELDAVLYYRNVRTTYFRATPGNASGVAPSSEMARVKVQ